MGVHDAPCEVQPDPEPLMWPRRGGVRLRERVEDSIMLGHQDTWPAVGHQDPQRRLAHDHLYLRRLVVGERECVREDDRDRTSSQLAVGPDLAIEDLALSGEPQFFTTRLELFAGFVCCVFDPAEYRDGPRAVEERPAGSADETDRESTRC